MDERGSPANDEVDRPPPGKPGERRWEPPERPLVGRALFFVTGAAAVVGASTVAGFVEVAFPFGTPGHWSRWVVFSLPVLLAGYVVYRRVTSGRRWRWLSYTLGAAAVPAAGLAVVGLWTLLAPPPRSPRFDPQDWSAEPLLRGGVRAVLVDLLMEADGLVGRPIDEVEALLGPDDPAGDGFEDYDRVWALGSEEVAGPVGKRRRLVVRVDENGVVTEARVVED